MGFRLSNVIGAPFRNYVSEQLYVRASKGSTDVRSSDEVLFLANKNSWVRLMSSVDVDEAYLRYLKTAYSEAEGFTFDKGDDLAKNWILQAGTSQLIGGKTQLRSGLGFNAAYGLGGIQDQGYRPMPGLDSVTIETAGRLGSLRYATINFKVWNMNQLDVIDALYFRLGFTMLLEWGHVNYYTNDQKYTTSTGGIANFFPSAVGEVVAKESVQYAINSKVRETDGNYDGMLGTVTNFNYSFNQEGGWDCSIKLIGLGNIIDTQKINSQYKMPEGLAKDFKKAQDVLLKLLREQAQLRARQLAQQQLDEAVGNFRVQEAAVKQRNPITDRLSAYRAQLKNQTATLDLATDIDPKTNNLRALLNMVAVSAGRTKDAIAVANLSSERETLRLDANNNDVLYVVDGEAYPAWITKGPPNTLTPAGFRYPIKQGSVYDLNTARLNSFAEQAIKRNFETVGGIPYVTTVGWNSFFGTIDPRFYVLSYAATAPSSRYSNALKVTTPNKGSSFYASQDLILSFNGIPRVGQQTENFTANWYIEGVTVTFANSEITTRASGDEIYVSAEKVREYVDAHLKSNPKWEITAVTVDELPTKADVYSVVNGGGNFRESLDYKLKQTKLTLTTQIGGTPGTGAKLRLYNNDTIQGPGVDNGKEFESFIQISLQTNLAGVLTELVRLSPGVEGLPEQPNISQYNTQAVVSSEDREQVTAPLNSALEAMLTIIKFKGIAVAKGAGSVGTIELAQTTAQLLKDLNSAPLNRIFNGDTLATPLPAPAQPDDPAINLYQSPYAMGLKGYCTSLMSFQVDKDKKDTSDSDLKNYYANIPNVDFASLMKAYVLRKTYTDSSYTHEGLTGIEKPTYISLGYLLFFINNVCLLFDSTKKAKTQQATPYFYIDFNPETNFCLTMPAHMSVDPQICILPWKGRQEDYVKLFDNMKVKNLNNIFNFQTGDIVSGKISKFNGGSKYQGKTMEILVNVSYLLDVLKQTANTDGHNDVYFRPFMDRVLADINKATGDINAFRVAYFDASNTAAIVDDQFVPPGEKESSENLLRRKTIDPTGKTILPVFEKRSIARSLDFETNISTKMSSMIAIGARSSGTNGSTQSTDGSSLYWLSEGLKDRVITEVEDLSKVKDNPAGASDGSQSNTKKTTSKDKEDNTLTLATNFNSYIKSIYSSDSTIDKKNTEAAKNYYIQALTAEKGADFGTSGAPIIPLNLNVSLDGISGINMGNVFLLPEERLPISLRAFPTGGAPGKPRFAWMVVGLNHQISGNQWLTNIRGQIIRLRPEESYAQRGSTSIAQGSTQGSSNASGLPSSPLGFGLPHGVPWRIGSTLYRNRAGKKFQVETRTGGTDLNHQGIDVNGPRLGAKDATKSAEIGGKGTSNDPIYATYDGVVTRAGTADGYGYAVYIKHDVNGVTYTSVYGHMPQKSITVSVGDKVVKGQQIALIGNEGHSTGYHLHFELWKGEKASGELLDPLDWLPYFQPLGGIVPDNETIKLTPKVYG